MDIGRKMQIANIMLATVAVVLSVVACSVPNVVYWAMWAWSITLWLFIFLVPMPVIQRNKKSCQIAYGLTFLLAVVLAVAGNTWLNDYPATAGFSRGVLIYTVTYTVLALFLAVWLKVKEKKITK